MHASIYLYMYIYIYIYRRYLAVAEKGRNEAAMIHVYDVSTFRRKKTLVYADVGADSYVRLALTIYSSSSYIYIYIYISHTLLVAYVGESVVWVLHIGQNTTNRRHWASPGGPFLPTS